MIHLPNIQLIVPPKVTRNMFFASPNYFTGQTMSRRDDIIQIVYNLIYLTNPQDFKMAKIFMESANLFSDMSEYKSNTSPNDICSDERTKCLLPILEEAYSYGYSDTP